MPNRNEVNNEASDTCGNAERVEILGVSLGDPCVPRTYSGVPCHLFPQLEKLGCLVGAVNGYRVRVIDVFRGALDIRRSLRAVRPHKNAIWRYGGKGQNLLTKRLDALRRANPPHNVLLQIGVGPLPLDDIKLVAHIEISVKTAIESELFGKTYGFSNHSAKAIRTAILGEQEFIRRCDLIWTNSHWTANTLIEQGADTHRIFIHPPAAAINDPGEIRRNWEKPTILFIGTQWKSKGGDLLLEAFNKLRRERQEAKLIVVGCDPGIREDGVEITGFLNKRNKVDRDRFETVLRGSTIFCMPSFWEATGIVYMEAALWGLPVVMLKGQGREAIFPPSMSVHLDEPCPDHLAEVLRSLSDNPEEMSRMGQAGRRLVLENYTYEILASRLYNRTKTLFY